MGTLKKNEQSAFLFLGFFFLFNLADRSWKSVLSAPNRINFGKAERPHTIFTISIQQSSPSSSAARFKIYLQTWFESKPTSRQFYAYMEKGKASSV
jgi:hypothetical protein